MKGKNVTELVSEWALNIAKESGLELWDVEFKKEGSDWFLRVYIDADRPISTDDCERVSRAVEKKLDSEDPIEQSYYLEVSSPGIERTLRKEEHFLKFIGHTISVKLYKEQDGQKTFTGELLSFENGVISIKEGERTVTFDTSKTAHIKLYEDF